MGGSYNESDKSISCPFGEECGGCTYINVPYEKELKIKNKSVSSLMSEYCRCEDIVGMFRPVFYRNKVHRVVSHNKKSKTVTGTYRENTHIVVPVDCCMIEDKRADEIIATLRSLFDSFKFKPYNEDKGTGFVRHILIRRGFSTNEIMVVIVTATSEFPSKNNFLNALLKAHPDITTVVQNINNMSNSLVLGKRCITLYGKGYIEDVLIKKRFRISPDSFFQINPSQTEKLYKEAIKAAGITRNDTVIDAYCGTGTIGIIAADSAKKVIGVELNKKAVEDAKLNAKLNNVNNISFFNQDAGEFLVEYAVDNKADVVILDPPRSGSSKEFLDSLLKIKPDRIVYISCNPTTQQRDVKILVKGGYKVDKCVPFDLFPHTEHVETICLLSRKAPV